MPISGAVAMQLGGATQAFTSKKKADIVVAANSLMTCLDHHGVHHFAVIDNGRTIVMSEVGLACLLGRGIKIDDKES